MKFATKKQMRALQAEIDNLKSALNNGVLHIQPAQTNVTQPGGATTTITEGPTTGSTRLHGGRLVILLSNPGGK